MTTKPNVDMTKGVYRKVYAGFLWGERISSVSMVAEAWFWRLHAIADDLGNLPGESKRLSVEAGGRRRITPKQAQNLTEDLAAVGLIVRYQVDGTDYIHIIGFEERQPGRPNGSRIQRHPEPPPEALKDGVNTPESGSEGIRVNPSFPEKSAPPNPNPNPNPIPSPTSSPAPTPSPGRARAADDEAARPGWAYAEFEKAWGSKVPASHAGPVLTLCNSVQGSWGEADGPGTPDHRRALFREALTVAAGAKGGKLHAFQTAAVAAKYIDSVVEQSRRTGLRPGVQPERIDPEIAERERLKAKSKNDRAAMVARLEAKERQGAV